VVSPVCKWVEKISLTKLWKSTKKLTLSPDDVVFVYKGCLPMAGMCRGGGGGGALIGQGGLFAIIFSVKVRN